MPHYSSYRCTKCGLPAERETLYVKRVSFSEMGASSKILKSRTVDHICSECIDSDPEWNLPARRAPGNISEALEEVRAIRAAELK